MCTCAPLYFKTPKSGQCQTFGSKVNSVSDTNWLGEFLTLHKTIHCKNTDKQILLLQGHRPMQQDTYNILVSISFSGRWQRVYFIVEHIFLPQVAESEGMYLASCLNTGSTKPFSFASRGMLAYIGNYDGLTDLPQGKLQGQLCIKM